MAGTSVVVKDTKGLAELLESRRDQLAAVMPKHVSVDELLRAALVAAVRNPKLFECTKESVLLALTTAASLGLTVSPFGNRGHLVPYGNVATFIPGYQGLMDLAYRSGRVDLITSDVVHENDKFSIEKGSNPQILHTPCLTGDRGRVVAYYGLAFLKGQNRPIFEYMTDAEVEEIRKRSRAGNAGPWVTDRIAMGRKTVLRRLCKYLPFSPDLQKALDLDAEAEQDNAGAGDILNLADYDNKGDALVSQLGGFEEPKE